MTAMSQMSLRARETLKHPALFLSLTGAVSISASRARSDNCDIAQSRAFQINECSPLWAERGPFSPPWTPRTPLPSRPTATRWRSSTGG